MILPNWVIIIIFLIFMLNSDSEYMETVSIMMRQGDVVTGVSCTLCPQCHGNGYLHLKRHL